MDDIAVRTTKLAKLYKIGERQPYLALRDAIAALAFRRRVRASITSSDNGQWIWALRDLSLEVGQGEALGIIGRNGAGKTTLLKILSRISPPTEGEAVVAGRVGSLLEVGTGFHPELTGRENVTLNGAILGMSRADIRRRFDEIVMFAGVERFIDTPLKRYSSGMRARLAFAVAAHLEPDILIVDEVLAVGDAEFQRRCMGKMGEAARSGRTVLFVSHNMSAIESLCNRAIWLDQGRCVAEGSSSEVVSKYLATSFSSRSEQSWDAPGEAPGNDRVRIRRVSVRPENGVPADPIDVTTPIAMEFEYWNLRDGARLYLSLHIYNEQGAMVFNALPTEEPKWRGRPFPRGLFRDVCHVPGNLLNDGVHRVELLVVEDSAYIIYSMDDALMFDVWDVATGREGWYGRWLGAVRPRLQWETELLERADSELQPLPPANG
jgi:homopolymeric O-antigen transport system ATP-binding protein